MKKFFFVFPYRPGPDNLRRMKYGIAVTWDGPTGDQQADDDYRDSTLKMVANALSTFSQSLKAENMPPINYTLIFRDETALTPNANQA